MELRKKTEEYMYFASEVTDNVFSNTYSADKIWTGEFCTGL